MWPWVSSTAAGVSRFSSRIRRRGAKARWPGSTTMASAPARGASDVAVALQHPRRKPREQHVAQFPTSRSRGSQRLRSAMPGTLGADCEHVAVPATYDEEDCGGADQRTAAGDGQAQTRAPAGAQGGSGEATATLHDHRLGGRSDPGDRGRGGHRRSSPTRGRTAIPPRPTRRRADLGAARPAADGKLPAVRRPRRSRRELPVPGRRGGQQEGQPAAHRQGARPTRRRSAPA